MDAYLTKIDLVKSFDNVDWEYLRNISIGIQSIEWIMACIILVNFAVIINGLPTTFFKALRVLDKVVCCLHYFFLLVIDELSRRIGKARSIGLIKRVRMMR